MYLPHLTHDWQAAAAAAATERGDNARKHWTLMPTHRYLSAHSLPSSMVLSRYA